MPHHVYVIYSAKLDRFYIGNTDLSPDERLVQHNEAHNHMSYTSKGIPWVLFLVLECTSREQARKVELHIKRMKSKQYIRNLKKYSEMQEKLLAKYSF